jgi:hypothetical protein
MAVSAWDADVASRTAVSSKSRALKVSNSGRPELTNRLPATRLHKGRGSERQGTGHKCYPDCPMHALQISGTCEDKVSVLGCKTRATQAKQAGNVLVKRARLRCMTNTQIRPHAPREVVPNKGEDRGATPERVCRCRVRAVHKRVQKEVHVPVPGQVDILVTPAHTYTATNRRAPRLCNNYQVVHRTYPHHTTPCGALPTHICGEFSFVCKATNQPSVWRPQTAEGTS